MLACYLFKLLQITVLQFTNFLDKVCYFFAFSVIGCGVKFASSISHLNISLIVVHFPSPCDIFSVKLGLDLVF